MIMKFNRFFYYLGQQLKKNIIFLFKYAFFSSNYLIRFRDFFINGSILSVSYIKSLV